MQQAYINWKCQILLILQIICFWQYLWLSSIQDHRPSMHPSKGRVSLGRQHDAGYVVWAALLSAVALRTLYFTHFKLFYFPNVIGLVQWIIRFVMRTEPKASYRTVQYEYVYRYTPKKNIYIYIYNTHTHTHIYTICLLENCQCYF